VAVKSTIPGHYTADGRADPTRLIRLDSFLFLDPDPPRGRALNSPHARKPRRAPIDDGGDDDESLLLILLVIHADVSSTMVRRRPCLLTKATQNNEMDKVDILVATPLRLKSLVEKGKVRLSSVAFLVLDEADKLFEMGFVEQVDAAVAACDNPEVVRALFSATLPETVEQLARSVMTQPMRLTVGERNAASGTIAQRLVFCGQERGKLLALRQLINEGVKPPIIVFVQSKDRAKQLVKELSGDGLRLGIVHAAMSDAKRQAQVDRFRAGDTWVLVATDLMARGMDFVGVSTVVNYDFPGSPHSYVHRIGRSGRAGRPGAAVTLFTEEDADRGDLRAIANVMKTSGCEVPDWMLASGSSDPRLRRRKRKDGREDNPRREPIDATRAANQAARAAAKASRKRKKSGDRDQKPTRGGGEPTAKRARG
jgi:ATP-dependent RNA helicase DDX52/ROK1